MTKTKAESGASHDIDLKDLKSRVYGRLARIEEVRTETEARLKALELVREVSLEYGEA